MKFAYADPPYIGYAKYYKNHKDYNGEVDHKKLIEKLMSEYPDGWALSCYSNSLKEILSYCPKGIRVMAWVKPMCSFKPNVNPAYAWEPVIVWGGRKRTRSERTVRDWIAVNITMKKGLIGAKPTDFIRWILAVLNVQPHDEFHDLYPGTGIVSKVHALECSQKKLVGLVQ